MAEKFDFDTIYDFDNHIEKSIPNYPLLIDSIKSISEYFFCKSMNIYDLGCSTGKLLLSIPSEYNRIGYDNSNLLPVIFSNSCKFEKIDLNKEFLLENACLVYSIFTMQFLNPNNRLKYLRAVYDGLNVGGAFILCEKVYQKSGKIQDILSFAHYDFKLKNFSAEDIISKERELRYIMKPCVDGEIKNMLLEVGFLHISEFWQMFNFKGYIAIK